MSNSRYQEKIANQGLYLIAEAGSNHNGSYNEAKRLIKLAAEAGADAIKFQLFRQKSLVHAEALGKELGLSPGWEKEIKDLEFDPKWLAPLKRLADRAGIEFLATAFDPESLELLQRISPPVLKIASGDITYLELLKKVARLDLPVILSTGASTQDEITRSVELIGREKTALLQCVMRYPAKNSSYPIESLKMLARISPVIGISDHTEGIYVSARAVEAGAIIVEKHFTRDRRQRGADHAMSLEPQSLKALKSLLNESLKLRQAGLTQPEDHAERVFARRGYYTRKPIKAGEAFTPENCVALRPALEGVVPASDEERLYRKLAGRDYQAFEPIEVNILE